MRSQKGNSAILVVFLVIALMALTGVSVYFWQSYEKEKAANASKMSTSAEETDSAPANSDYVMDTKPTPQPEAKKEPVVVFTPGGLFTDAETAEIKKKFVNPFNDFNNEYDTVTVSVSIEKPVPAIAGYKYKITYINEGGGNGGFLYGTSTPLEWWLPECMGGCKLSAEFQAKYPEIMAKIQ